MAQILIVDDSPTETHILSTILDKHGYTVITVDNGEDGVTAAAEKKPDLILMDVVMPGMNGFQATRKITKSPETSHIPVILVTTKDQETDRVWGMRQGAKDYITKPVSEDQLIEKITTQLSGE
ncbi:MAG: response regulator [Gammaproteobacteria bacterium]|nr:response regulator [Gammaproteobacteria bacterium]